MSNPHEALARLRKANRLADILEVFSGTPADASALPAEGRRMTEQLAHVNVASDATWAMVPEILRNRAHAHAMAALILDPFEGVAVR